MPIKMNHYCVYDLETSSIDPYTCQPIQIACRFYNCRSLELIPGSEFCEYAKPTEDCVINQEVFNITKIDPALVDKAASIKIIWPKFVEHVMKYNISKDKWGAAIPVAHNLNNFDLIIANKMTERFCKKGQVLFNFMHRIDTINLAHYLFEDSKDLPSYSLDSLREYFGLSKDGAHKADKDVEHLAQIAMELLKTTRKVSKNYISKLKGSFKKANG